jgi:hypothetical protein
MTPGEMAQACAEAVEKGLKVQLVLPRKATGRRYMRLFGRRGPLGEVACENGDGHTVVWVDPLDLLAWLAAQGLVNVAAAKESA